MHFGVLESIAGAVPDINTNSARFLDSKVNGTLLLHSLNWRTGDDVKLHRT